MRAGGHWADTQWFSHNVISSYKQVNHVVKSDMEEHYGRRRWPLVVLTSSPFHGHMIPPLQLATTLHAKGFPIAIAHSNLNPPNPSNYPSDFTFHPLFEKKLVLTYKWILT
ncbi:hypothetical protein HanPI659440_Chr08g0314391 [Helianthus annuus]|nr:hypothetical protein HanPI659440_Chr08g0314391 [Helianthus annuus]